MLRITSLCSGPRIPFMTARTLYGVQVRMNTSRMAESVLAAFLSCLFSCVAFFILFFLGRELAGRLAGWETLFTYLNENCCENLAWCCDYYLNVNTTTVLNWPKRQQSRKEYPMSLILHIRAGGGLIYKEKSKYLLVTEYITSHHEYLRINFLRYSKLFWRFYLHQDVLTVNSRVFVILFHIGICDVDAVYSLIYSLKKCKRGFIISIHKNLLIRWSSGHCLFPSHRLIHDNRTWFQFPKCILSLTLTNFWFQQLSG